MPILTPPTTLPPITTLNNLDRSLLDSSLPKGIELQQATSLVNTIVRSSTLKTPIKQYIKQLEAAVTGYECRDVLTRVKPRVGIRQGRRGLAQ
jgi:hypothetical protein